MSHVMREFSNPFPNYAETESADIINDGRLTEKAQKSIKESLQNLLLKLEHKLENYASRDNSVYTGSAGIGLLYLHLSETIDESYLSNALTYCHESTKNLSGRPGTFLCGDSGPLALSAVLNHKLGKTKESQENIERLESFHHSATSSGTPDELLYGRSGYLYCLLFVQKHIQKSAIKEAIIRKVIDCILKSGSELSSRENLDKICPLFYVWHDKPYLGAAHGLTGILYTLLQAREYISSVDLETLIKPTILHVMSLKFSSGNFLSSVGSSNDKLVHWCHGAPGTLHLMALAYQVFGDDVFLEAATGCCQVIWGRGLLRKGYGICHGVAGNAYAFLRMHQLTEQDKYLYQAYRFAEWCFAYDTRSCNKPDRPLSLFEGLAGTIYFLADMLKPEKSAFPAFQLF